MGAVSKQQQVGEKFLDLSAAQDGGGDTRSKSCLEPSKQLDNVNGRCRYVKHCPPGSRTIFDPANPAGLILPQS
jgi:hypothetical protein